VSSSRGWGQKLTTVGTQASAGSAGRSRHHERRLPLVQDIKKLPSAKRPWDVASYPGGIAGEFKGGVGPLVEHLSMGAVASLGSARPRLPEDWTRLASSEGLGALRRIGWGGFWTQAGALGVGLSSGRGVAGQQHSADGWRPTPSGPGARSGLSLTTLSFLTAGSGRCWQAWQVISLRPRPWPVRFGPKPRPKPAP